MNQKPDYRNWVPKGMIAAMGAGTAVLAAGAAALGVMGDGALSRRLSAVLSLGALTCGFGTLWSVNAHNAFSYEGDRQISRKIVEGTAEYVTLPEGGRGLDVGCGSGALTIACAKRNPQGTMLGVDRWGPEYASFSKELCERNAAAENMENVSFQKGDAVHLDFPDETFDAVTSNYVYHNITGHDRKELLLETLRVLKKGGTFAIHDLMSPARYGDMTAFMEELRRRGYARVEFLETAKGRFLPPMEARILGLGGSALLIGQK